MKSRRAVSSARRSGRRKPSKRLTSARQNHRARPRAINVLDGREDITRIGAYVVWNRGGCFRAWPFRALPRGSVGAFSHSGVFFLAAYAVSGRLLWLVAAVLLAGAVIFKKRMDHKRRRNALLALAPLDATDEQREAFRERIPEYPKIKNAWWATSLRYPTPWKSERETWWTTSVFLRCPHHRKRFAMALTHRSICYW